MMLKSFLNKKYISPILIIFCIELFAKQPSTICPHDSHTIQTNKINNHHYISNRNSEINIQSDSVNIKYPEEIQLFGHVNIKINNNIMISDKLTILRNKNNNNLSDEITLYADGNIRYYNDYILLTGSNAQFKLNNNINIYKGTFYLNKINIYGTANTIMQRKNNQYTIIKHGDITACISDDNYWKITGSKITYDHYKNNIDIWNARFKIKNIPLFYSPYLSFSLNTKNILKSYIPNIQYSNRNGLILKIPFPLNFSKYYSGNIAPYYASNFKIGLQTKTYYSIKPGIGSIMLNITENKKTHDLHYNHFYKLQWKHNGIMNKTWHFNIDYFSSNNPIRRINDTHNNINNIFNNDINQKIFCYYSNKNYKASLAYLGNNNIFKNTIIQNYYIYNAAPQLELHAHWNIMSYKLLNLYIFNQFSKFVPINNKDPRSVRIHTEPMIRFSLNNHFGKFYTESKLKITHYKQTNINNYNLNTHEQYKLQNTINRIIPQFKIIGNMSFQNNINTIQQYKYILEPKLQYLYIPYTFQENIGIYDTKIVYQNHNNLFHDTGYSGLDRIFPVNRITGNINIRCINNTKDKFYLSIGHILDLKTYKLIHNYNINSYKYTTLSTKKLLSGTGYWSINNNWNINSEIQYNTIIKKLLFGNTTLKYIGKNNQIFQTNYRYINAQYFQENTIEYRNMQYNYQTISQLGIVFYYPVIHNWKISYTHYQNIKTNNLIDQAIGIQNITPCWLFNIMFERKIINWDSKYRIGIYDNIIKINYNIYYSQSNSKTDLHKILRTNMIPYHYVL